MQQLSGQDAMVLHAELDGLPQHVGGVSIYAQSTAPDAPFKLHMCGAALIDSISLGLLLPNVGLFHIVYSSVQNKRGATNLSFSACRHMLPDPAFYADCLQDSFEELRDAALSG